MRKENTPLGDSRSNGPVENATKRVAEPVRVMNDSLETNLGVRVETSNPIFDWMAEWAAGMLTRHVTNPDSGRTPYQEIGSKTCSADIAEFGERVHYLPLKSQAHINEKSKIEPKARDGIYLGMRMRPQEHLIGTLLGGRESQRHQEKAKS